MCLLTYQKEPIILEEDKTVWKILNKSSYGQRNDFVLYGAIYYFKEYELNKLYKTKITSTNKSNWKSYGDLAHKMYTTRSGLLEAGVRVYQQGFHSFYNKQYFHNARGSEVIVECRIPKGSEYYEDLTGLCISNQIILLKEI